MSWYKQAQQSEKAFFAKNKAVDYNASPSPDQVGQYYTMFDVQRYVMDSYSMKVAISKTKTKYAVSFLCNHDFLGSVAWSAYWAYDVDQFKEAVTTYEKVKVGVGEVVTKFVEEEIPTSIFWPFMRHKLYKIDNMARSKKNIPYVNYTRDLEYSPDWRENIYGTRYPTYEEKSYAQYLNSGKCYNEARK